MQIPTGWKSEKGKAKSKRGKGKGNGKGKGKGKGKGNSLMQRALRTQRTTRAVSVQRRANS